MKRVGRSPSTIIALVAALSLLLVSPAGAANPNKVGPPNSMAAAGDSITRAFNAGFWPFMDSPGRSWSTGVDRHVRGHYLRILAIEPAIRDRNHNLAVTGARVSDLVDQVSAVNARRVAYVTILIGPNDLCTETVGSMTSVEDFESRFEEAMALLSAGSPRARIFVVSIPNIKRLWLLFKDDFLARTAWRLLGVCRSLLARPRSTDPEDVERRSAFKERNRAFNRVLADVCLEYVHCRFDGRTVFRDRFTRDHVSRRDYFHPSRDGQRRLARVTWGAAFDFSDRTPPASEAQTLVIPDGTLVTLVATDDVGVSGIEYRINRGPFRRYESPLVLGAGTELRFRAVDVNGNIEETHILVV